MIRSIPGELILSKTLLRVQERWPAVYPTASKETSFRPEVYWEKFLGDREDNDFLPLCCGAKMMLSYCVHQEIEWSKGDGTEGTLPLALADTVEIAQTIGYCKLT